MALGFKTLRNVFGGLKNVVKPVDIYAAQAESLELDNFKFDPGVTLGEVTGTIFTGSLIIKDSKGIEIFDLAGTGVQTEEEERYLIKVPISDDLYDPSLYEPFKHLHGVTLWGNSVYFAAPSRGGEDVSIEEFQELLAAGERFKVDVRNVFEDYMYIGYTAELNAFLNEPDANVYEPTEPV